MRKTLLSIVLLFVATYVNAEPTMYAHFIDVGQADATLLEFPCGAILIDAGAQDSEHIDFLVDYLNEFFRKRPDLNRTLNTVIITHNHIDHTSALKSVVENFSIESYVDNGQEKGRGTENPNWLKDKVKNGSLNINVYTVEQSKIEGLSHKSGLLNSHIDHILQRYQSAYRPSRQKSKLAQK